MDDDDEQEDLDEIEEELIKPASAAPKPIIKQQVNQIQKVAAKENKKDSGIKAV